MTLYCFSFFSYGAMAEKAAAIVGCWCEWRRQKKKNLIKNKGNTFIIVNVVNCIVKMIAIVLSASPNQEVPMEWSSDHWLDSSDCIWVDQFIPLYLLEPTTAFLRQTLCSKQFIRVATRLIMIFKTVRSRDVCWFIQYREQTTMNYK